MTDRYGSIKTGYSCYDFGVVSNTPAGSAEKFDRQITEIDARFVTPTGGEPEVQISVKVTNCYAKRDVSVLGGMYLRPADAEALAMRLAPSVGELLQLMGVATIAEAKAEIIELRKAVGSDQS